MTIDRSVPKRILIVGPSWVGDMVMAQCLLKLLKSRYPDCELDVLAPTWTFSLLACMPEVTTAIELPFKHGEFNLFGRLKLALRLRPMHYDQAIVLPNTWKAALIPWIARIPIRTGWCGESRYGLLNDLRQLDKTRYPLMIEQYMALGLPPDEPLAQPYAYPQFQVTTQAQQEVLSNYQLKGLTQHPILAMAAGSEYGSSKRWPPEYFAEVANHMLQKGWKVWLFGSAKDRFITTKIMQLTYGQCEQIAGRTQLSETIQLLSVTKGLVTNDSGLMHVAAALNKPLVALYGSTSPKCTPPLFDQATILQLELECQPCFARECPLQHHRCMRDLKPNQVIKVIDQWELTDAGVVD